MMLREPHRWPIESPAFEEDGTDDRPDRHRAHDARITGSQLNER